MEKLQPCNYQKYYEDGCKCPACVKFEAAQHKQVQNIIKATNRAKNTTAGKRVKK